MTQGKITCSACSHAFAVPPNARTAICPRCGQALPVFFGSIEPTEVPAVRRRGDLGEDAEQAPDPSGAKLARIKLKKHPVTKPPPLPKMPPPPPPEPTGPPPIGVAPHPGPDPLTVPPGPGGRPDLPPSAPPTIPQMVTDMPEPPGSFVGAPQFSRVPMSREEQVVDDDAILGEHEIGTEIDPGDGPTYQMDGPPWMDGGDEMTGPDLPRRIKGPPIDMAYFTPTTPPEYPPPDVPAPEERSLVATKAGAMRPPRPGKPPPPPSPPSPLVPPPPAGRPPPLDYDDDVGPPPIDYDDLAALAGPATIEESGGFGGEVEDLDQRVTHAAVKPPALGPPPADPLDHLPTEFDVDVMDDEDTADEPRLGPPLQAQVRGDSYYDLSQSARVAALDAAITDSIEPDVGGGGQPGLGGPLVPPPPPAPPPAAAYPRGAPPAAPPPRAAPPPAAPPPTGAPPQRYPDDPAPYAPSPSSVLHADDHDPLPEVLRGPAPPRSPTAALPSQPPAGPPLGPPPGRPVNVPPPSPTPGPPPALGGPMNTSSAPFALEQTGIMVFIPNQPVEEVQAGQPRDVVVSPAQLAAASAPEADDVGELEAPASRRIVRSAAGHGVAVRGAVIAAERRKTTLTTVLIVAGVAALLAVGGVIAYVVLA